MAYCMGKKRVKYILLWVKEWITPKGIQSNRTLGTVDKIVQIMLEAKKEAK